MQLRCDLSTFCFGLLPCRLHHYGLSLWNLKSEQTLLCKLLLELAFYPIDTKGPYVEVGASCAVSTTPQAPLLLRHAMTSFTSWLDPPGTRFPASTAAGSHAGRSHSSLTLAFFHVTKVTLTALPCVPAGSRWTLDPLRLFAAVLGAENPWLSPFSDRKLSWVGFVLRARSPFSSVELKASTKWHQS